MKTLNIYFHNFIFIFTTEALDITKGHKIKILIVNVISSFLITIITLFLRVYNIFSCVAD